MITEHTWPAQLRLRGQAAAADGPIDMYGMYLMHHAFRRDLGRFVTAARETPVDDRRTWRLLAARWEVFAKALHDHHTSEDVHIWPYVERRADDEERLVLDAMHAEHQSIDPLLERCRAQLGQLSADASTGARKSLHADLVAARDLLDRHLAHEEEAAIPIIQRHITAEEWARLEKEELQKDARIRDAFAVVPWAMYDVPRPARERAFGAPGGAAFRFLWLLTRGRFARRERRTFRHA